MGLADVGQLTIKQLGDVQEGKCRPILVETESTTIRNRIVAHAKNLKDDGEQYKKIRVKKDTHPAVRREWKRLFDA